MNWQSITFDWNQVRAFLVTAEEGTLSAAARALGLTQPTLGRQVAALEEELGVALFERDGRRLMRGAVPLRRHACVPQLSGACKVSRGSLMRAMATARWNWICIGRSAWHRQTSRGPQ